MLLLNQEIKISTVSLGTKTLYSLLQKLGPLFRSSSTRAAIVLVQFYQVVASPIFGGACRFEPSCSQYAIQALEGHRLDLAIILIFKRLMKCRPGGPFGSDPVPGVCHTCGGSHGK